MWCSAWLGIAFESLERMYDFSMLLHNVGSEHATSTLHYFVYDKNNIFRLSFIWVANGMMHQHRTEPFMYAAICTLDELLSRIIHFRISVDVLNAQQKCILLFFRAFVAVVGVCFLLCACCRPTNANLNNSIEAPAQNTHTTNV